MYSLCFSIMLDCSPLNSELNFSLLCKYRKRYCDSTVTALIVLVAKTKVFNCCLVSTIMLALGSLCRSCIHNVFIVITQSLVHLHRFFFQNHSVKPKFRCVAQGEIKYWKILTNALSTDHWSESLSERMLGASWCM